MRLAAFFVALIALGVLILEVGPDWNAGIGSQEDYRAPVANPPVDPQRPDLFEEPRIDD